VAEYVGYDDFGLICKYRMSFGVLCVDGVMVVYVSVRVVSYLRSM